MRSVSTSSRDGISSRLRKYASVHAFNGYTLTCCDCNVVSAQLVSMFHRVPPIYSHDVFRKYGYLTFPHDVSRTSMEAVKQHRHFAFWQMKGIRWVQRWLGEYKPPENTSDDSPTGTCEVQVVRSSSRWSHGIQTEHSIQNACM